MNHIHRGAFGVVKRATKKSSGEHFAVKIINKYVFKINLGKTCQMRTY
jgi:hypothetical protein